MPEDIAGLRLESKGAYDPLELASYNLPLIEMPNQRGTAGV